MNISITEARLKDYPPDHPERIKYEALLNSKKSSKTPLLCKQMHTPTSKEPSVTC
jgi:hypothetical protein